MQRKTRNMYIDVLRIIASIFVIYIHTGSNAFTLFMQYEPHRIKYWLCLFITILAKSPIPIFFGISGALLLPRQESLKDIWKKRISKFFMILLVFNFISYLLYALEGQVEFSWVEFFRGIYSSQWNYAYWYLYAYIGFLIILPFLRALVMKLEDKDYYYLFGIVVVLTGIIPVVEFFITPALTLNTMYHIKWLAMDIFVYPLMGYFLHHKLRPENEKKLLIKVWILNIVGILISVGMTYYGMKIGRFTNGENVQYFFESFVLVNSAAIFLTVKYIVGRIQIPERIEKLTVFMGNYTFGIYLIHPLLMWQVLDHINFCMFFITEWHMDYMPAGILFTLIMWVLSLAVTMILKCIPGIKKLL